MRRRRGLVKSANEIGKPSVKSIYFTVAFYLSVSMFLDLLDTEHIYKLALSSFHLHGFPVPLLVWFVHLQHGRFDIVFFLSNILYMFVIKC